MLRFLHSSICRLTPIASLTSGASPVLFSCYAATLPLFHFLSARAAFTFISGGLGLFCIYGLLPHHLCLNIYMLLLLAISLFAVSVAFVFMLTYRASSALVLVAHDAYDFSICRPSRLFPHPPLPHHLSFYISPIVLSATLPSAVSANSVPIVCSYSILTQCLCAHATSPFLFTVPIHFRLLSLVPRLLCSGF